MALDAAFLVHEGIAAFRALWVESLPDDDLVVLAVLPVFLVFRVDRAMHLERLDRRHGSR